MATKTKTKTKSAVNELTKLAQNKDVEAAFQEKKEKFMEDQSFLDFDGEN